MNIGILFNINCIWYTYFRILNATHLEKKSLLLKTTFVVTTNYYYIFAKSQLALVSRIQNLRICNYQICIFVTCYFSISLVNTLPYISAALGCQFLFRSTHKWTFIFFNWIKTAQVAHVITTENRSNTKCTKILVALYQLTLKIAFQVTWLHKSK